jgi:hypothetical protein
MRELVRRRGDVGEMEKTLPIAGSNAADAPTQGHPGC